MGGSCPFSKLSVTSPTSQLILILQAFRHFTYVTAHSPTLPSLYLRQNSFSNPSVASPRSQLILQPFFRFSYVTGFSLASPGEPPMNLRLTIDDFTAYPQVLFLQRHAIRSQSQSPNRSTLLGILTLSLIHFQFEH